MENCEVKELRRFRRRKSLKSFWLTLQVFEEWKEITERPFYKYFPEKHKFQFNPGIFINPGILVDVSFDKNTKCMFWRAFKISHRVL